MRCMRLCVLQQCACHACRCVALFAAGDVSTAMREMRAVLRKYPDFPDTRAALTAALWSIGKEGEAKTNWYVARSLHV
jgi:Flp pilus assembly protein TadD